MAVIASAGALGLTSALSALVSGVAVERRERLGEDLRDLTAQAERPAIQPPPPPAAVSTPAPSSTPALAPTAPQWQIQIGSFRDEAAAVAQLRSAAAIVPELAPYSLRTERYRGKIRARIGGIADAERARYLCATVTEAGSACYVVPPG